MAYICLDGSHLCVNYLGSDIDVHSLLVVLLYINSFCPTIVIPTSQLKGNLTALKFSC